MISAEEAERRRVSVRVALADSRIEGFPPPSGVELEIFDAYVRGDIDPADLVDAIKAAIGLSAEQAEDARPVDTATIGHGAGN